ncbi:hypothetical protein BgiMline_002910 [Biomphalaria glabrata]|nr:hypothetical protein BgiMline_011484 [Biomphalaria glabrata]
MPGSPLEVVAIDKTIKGVEKFARYKYRIMKIFFNSTSYVNSRRGLQEEKLKFVKSVPISGATRCVSSG